MKHQHVMNGLILGAALASGCCVYAEAPTRSAFNELSQDAAELVEAHKRCLEDPSANQSVCTQVQTTLQSISDNAAAQGKMGDAAPAGGTP